MVSHAFIGMYTCGSLTKGCLKFVIAASSAWSPSPSRRRLTTKEQLLFPISHAIALDFTIAEFSLDHGSSWPRSNFLRSLYQPSSLNERPRTM